MADRRRQYLADLGSELLTWLTPTHAVCHYPHVPTYIVTWNPRGQGWSEYDHDLQAHSDGRQVKRNWSFRNRSVQEGDRIFMLRQRDQRGIVASGHVVGKPFLAEPWRPDAGQPNTSVPILFDTILPVDDRLVIEQLVLRSPIRTGTRSTFQDSTSHRPPTPSSTDSGRPTSAASASAPQGPTCPHGPSSPARWSPERT